MRSKPENILDVMIDLETVGIRATSGILSIGAVAFTSRWVDEKFAKELNSLERTFYKKIDPEAFFTEGTNFTTDESTMLWWNKPENAEAKAEAFSGTTPTLQVLREFKDWISKLHFEYRPAKLRVWGRGANFDISILQHAYDVFMLAAPWKYQHVMCHRTYMETHSWVFKALSVKEALQEIQGMKHHALHDAIYQARQVILCEEVLNNADCD